MSISKREHWDSPMVLGLLVAVLHGSPFSGAHAAPRPAGDYYTEPRILEERPDPKREYFYGPTGPTSLGPVGPTGIEARIKEGVTVVVESTARGHGVGWTATPNHYFENNADWGDGEFLLMRTTFTVTDADLGYDYYRLRILSASGYQVYLNGHKLQGFPWTAHVPKYEKIMLGDTEMKQLKKGANTLAVYCMSVFEKGRNTEGYQAIGQMDVSIEGFKNADTEE